MSFYNSIVQIISSKCESYCDGCDHEAPAVTEISSIAALIDAFQGDLNGRPAVKKLLSHSTFKDRLKELGWINLAQAEKVSKKATLGTEFYIWDTRQSYSRPRAIDFDKLTAFDAEDLAKDTTKLLCSLTKASLHKLNRKVYNKLKEAKKKIAIRQKAAKKGAVARAKKAKAKKIAAAKKLLAEAGES